MEFAGRGLQRATDAAGPDLHPLSDAQRGVWLDIQRLGDRKAYQIGTLVTIKTEIDLDLARQAVRLIVARHESLRLRIDANAPVQWLQDDTEIPLGVVDLSAEADGDAAVRTHIARVQEQGFALGNEPLLKVDLLRLGPSDWRLMLICHHLIADGLSFAIIQQQWLAAYAMLAGDAPAGHDDAPAGEALARSSYLTFVNDDVAYNASARAETDLAYWQKRLTPLPQLLFDDRPRPEAGHATANIDLLRLDKESYQKFQTAARGANATTHRALVALLALALGRRYGRSDFALGMALHRRDSASRTVVGMIAGLIAVRCQLEATANLTTNVERIAAGLDADLRHARTAIDTLGRALNLAAEGRNGLFDAVVTILPPTGASAMTLAGTPISGTPLRTVEVTPLAVYVRELDAQAGLTIEFQFNPEILTAPEVARLRSVLAELIETFAKRPTARLSGFDGLSRDERAALDEYSQGAFREIPAAPLHAIVHEKALADPAAIAVESDDVTLTYAELDTAATRLAEALIAAGLQPGDAIGVAMTRQALSVVAILGILKAGAVYLPLDPAYPEARLSGMIADAGAKLILVRSGADVTLATDVPKHALDLATLLNAEATGASLPDVPPESRAYIIYTSGSTGRPKGVAVSHAAAVNLAYARQDHDPIGPGDRILAAISIGFDVSVGQLLLPLLSGAAIVVAGDVRGQSPQAFWDFMVRHRVTHVNSVPSFFDAMLSGVPATHSLKQLMLGGEALSGSLAKKLRERLGSVRIVNMYGPTETCIDASAYIVPETGAENIPVLPIGRPLPNYTFHILNERLDAVGFGTPGELFIGGAGLAEGYLGQPDLTAERFIEHPLLGRLYRTGDRAAWREDGEVMFLGRLDTQVKIRGNRIEVGEIEAVLLQHPAVAQAVVVARPSARGDKCLVAYLVTVPGSETTAVALKQHLAADLPEHMIPAHFQWIEKIPLTQNGKLDHRALPDPAGAARDTGTLPATPTEKLLARHVSGLLKVETVYLEDSFFTLGGHSLLATQLAARVRADLNIELPLRLLFEAPRLGDLARRIETLQPANDARRIIAGPRPERIPLSLSQERIWFVDRLQNDASYNIPVALRLDGALDEAALSRALEAIVHRHEALRTRIEVIDGAPVQIIDAPAPLGLSRVEASEAELPALVAKLAGHRFNLEAEHPFVFSLVTLAPEQHALVLVLHHALFDGWSAGVFYREFAALYSAFASGQDLDLPAPALQYADYAIWQRGQDWSDDLAFWKAELEDAPSVSNLPVKDGAASRASAAIRFELSPETHSALEAVAKANGASLFMIYHAAFAHVLARTAGQDDVVIGTAVANRTRAEVEDAIGCFVNTLPLRTRLQAGESFADLLARVKTADLAAFAHQDLPFEQLVQAVSAPRGMDQSPVFQTMLVLQNAPMPDAKLPGLAIAPIATDAENAKFDLTLSLVERNGLIEFARDRYDASIIERFAAAFQKVLSTVASDASIKLASIDLLDAGEKSLVLDTWNQTNAAFPQGTLDGLFRTQVAATPDAIAVVDAGRSYTYAELDAESDRVARWLVAQGVAPETVVGVKFPRSASTVIAFLAILKAGGAYLPLDPAYPADRLAYIAENAGAKLVLNSIDGLDADATLPVHDDATRLAYVIYTSGTTGQPKGVAVSHVAPVNLAFARKAAHDPIGPNDRILAAISVGFDVSIGQLLLPLLSGATVVVAGDIRTMEPAEFWRFLDDERVTHINSVPSFFDSILAAAPSQGLALKRVMLGGEALTGALVSRINRALPGVDVVNMYGPTEACIDALYHVATEADLNAAVLPIGKPLPNYKALILNADRQPVAIGTPGELWLAGPGLARGYVGADELTASRFLEGPVGRMYKTGDLARWRRDGAVEFLGRVDSQVKIRGFRVEPGEIANVLMTHDAIDNAVVVLRDGKLVAYFVAKSNVTAEDLRAHLAARLPDYMVPSAFVAIEAIPTNTNGKLDVKALPAPTFAERPYVAPRTETEQAVASFFADVLNLDRCGATDNFFELGGHSLMATRLVSKVRDLGVNLPLRTIFDAPTVEAIARAIDAAQTSGVTRIIAGPRPERIPLSLSQERIWFVDRLQNDASYNIPVALRLNGALDERALSRALEAIVHRHEALRTRIEVIDGAPVQIIDAPAPLALSRVEASEAELPALVAKLAGHRFNLDAEHPFVFSLVTLAPEQHALVLVLHHALFDGWSAGVFYREFAALYSAFANGQDLDLPAPALQYADYAIWQRSQDWSDDLAFWKAELDDAPPVSNLPVKDGAASRASAAIRFELSPETHSALEAVAKANGASLFMIYHAAFAHVLARTAGQDDVVIGTAVANRTRAEVEDAIGCFVNTLPLRTRLQSGESFADLLARVKTADLAAFAHQDLPFEQLVQAVSAPRGMDQSPVFQTMLVLQNAPMPDAKLPGLAIAPIATDAENAKFDLTLSLVERSGLIEFARDRYDASTIERFTAAFQKVLSTVATDASIKLASIDLLDPAEKTLVLDTWNQTDASFPQGTLDGLFRTQVAATPDAIAIVDAGRAYTYAELDTASDRVARWLVAQGVAPETVVGVKFPRSAATVITFLAILKAGGAYLPLDPAYPADRLAYIAENAGAKLVLNSIDGLDADATLPVHDDATRLAYVIYTSGTTGQPKGVAVSHVAPVNLAFARKAAHDPIGHGDRILAAISVGFDVSIGQLLLPLLSGATVVIAGDIRTMEPTDFWRFLADEQVTHINSVPSFFDSILAAAPSQGLALKRVMLGGEALTGALVSRINRALPGVDVVNMYGPTEACIDALYHVATEADLNAAVLPIGKPLPNYKALILNADRQPVAIGTPGELWLAGPGLARGYVGSEELTASRFISGPLGRMYKTGDLARWRRDGAVEFLGRVDSQVKIRGFRVEPGEIANVLMTHDAIANAVVILRDGKLVAYFVAKSNVTAEDLRAHLAARLPDYMVPSAFVAIEAIPTNTNGKLDVKALPAPTFAERPYIAPRTETEAAVASFFADVLNLDRCGATDNFFELGGHSLMAIRLVHQINTHFAIELPMRTLFEQPTVEGIAAAIARGPDLNAGNLMPIATRGTKPALFCIHPGGGHVFCYMPLARALGNDRPVFGIEARGLDGTTPLPKSIEEMAADYAKTIAAKQPDGPLYLLGMSLGGLIAFEVAHALNAMGRDVALLTMMDTTIPEDVQAVASQAFAEPGAPRPEQMILATLAAEFGIGDLVDETTASLEALVARAEAGNRLPPGFTAAHAQRIAKVFINMIGLQQDYSPHPYAGPILSIRALRRQFDAPPDWSRFAAGRIDVVDLDCAHNDLISDALAPAVAAAVRERL